MYSTNMKMISLVLSLPTENATVRMRAWRTLKASGAAVLRDGVYLMPDRESCRNTLETVAKDVLASGGSAYVLGIEESDSANFMGLFDRSEDYAALLADLVKVRSALTVDTAPDALKQVRKLRKAYANLADIDFYPGEAQRQADTALQDLELTIARVLSPDEPHAVEGKIPLLKVNDYQARTWATRHRPWVDRLACAWLIRRFIDPQAHFLWLDSPIDCPSDVLGFDFDGATFSHVGSRVTFEVLLASFKLEQPGLKRIGSLVHFLDVGGIQPPESSGVESVLAGLRDVIHDDDQLLITASTVFDGLLSAFNNKENLP
jgi:hypothetical protein